MQVPSHVLPETDPAAPNWGALFLQHSESQPSSSPFTDLRTDCACSMRGKETGVFIVSVLVRGFY